MNLHFFSLSTAFEKYFGIFDLCIKSIGFQNILSFYRASPSFTHLTRFFFILQTKGKLRMCNDKNQMQWIFAKYFSIWPPTTIAAHDV